MLQNIIPPRLKSVLAKRPQGSGGPWRKRALILCGLVLALLLIGHFGIRFIIWPQIEKSKASVERLISARIGVDVTMDDLRVSWTGIRPDFEIDGLRFNNSDKSHSLLQIQKIRGELSWNSFYHLAPYFHELYFENAEIYAQRDSKGIISVAGIPIHGNSNGHEFENWLMSQDKIVVGNVKLFWTNKLDKKITTSIEIQDLDLTNGIRSHQATLTTTTPWTNGPLGIKADFVHRLGSQPGNWRNWIGSISWDVADLKLDQIAKEFSLPLNTLEGKLSSKGKLKIDNGQPDGGEAYIAADNLIVQLEKNEDAIALGRLETNLFQENDSGLISVTTKTFAWREIASSQTAPLENLSPMTFSWKPPGADGEIKEFGFSSPKILVEDVALFALNLPLPKKVRQWIKASQADGELQDLDVHWSESKSALSALKIPGTWFKSNKLDFSVSAKLVNLSFVGIDKSMPSVSNLSGSIVSDQNQGSFSIKSTDLELNVNDLLADPKIKLDRANGQVSWSKKKGNWVINAKQLALSNPEIDTTLDINYVIGDPKKPDQLTLDMNFASANLDTTYRYLPIGMGKDVQLYLSKAFSAGTIQKGSLHIKGDPNGVPFSNAAQGEFTLNLPIVGATFSPVPLLPSSQGVWSAFSKANGILTMQNSRFMVDVSRANYKDVVLNQFHAEIPNVSAKQLVLSVSGNAQGNAPQMLEYLFASPFAKKQSRLEKNLRVSGPINLDLGLKVPLSNNDDVNADIKVALSGNKAQWSNLPPLENLNGKIRITEINPEFEDISANFLGGSLKISSSPSAPGKQNFNITGDMTASFIKDYLVNTMKTESTSILEAMSGSTKYQGTLSFNKTGSETNLKFDLRNWASAAPAPAKKLMGIPMTGQITLKTTSNNQSGTNHLSWNGKLGDIYTVQGDLNSEGEFRYALGIGALANLSQPGFQLNLASNELNLDDWLDFFKKQKQKNDASQIDDDSANNIHVTAQVKNLTLFDRTWQDINLSASNKNIDWQMRINSPLIAGQIQYQIPNKTHVSGLISGRLNRLKVPDEPSPSTDAKSPSTETAKSVQKNSGGKSKLSPNAIPSLDLTIDDFNWSKAHLGQTKFKTKTSNNLLTIESIQFNNPQGSSINSGQWIGATANQQEHSNINIDLDVKDTGLIIANWSSQKSVEGGQGRITANAEWDGSPFSPKYETLTGKINLTLEKGRLLEVDTSGAQILDVLSLQSLFKFATLDLQGSLGNIVSKGTPFNSINASFDISNGLAQTKQFTMSLDQARVAMTGQINVPKQTQDLRITIFPTIDATAASLAAFAINPIVGLGALVGQYLITNQINRNLQSDYLVQGSWDKPEVIPLDQKGQPIDAKTLNTIRSKDLLKEQTKPDTNSTPTPKSQTQTL
ncbi:MAG: YhdP family protein [Polynucleobacter sp.]